MRFTASLLLGASLVSTAMALPASTPTLVDLEPFKNPGFDDHGHMTAEDAEALVAKLKAEEAAAPSLATRNTHAEAAALFAESRRTSTCKNPEVRVEWRNFSHENRVAWVKAARCLYTLPPRAGFPHSKSVAEDMQYLHQQLMETIHDVGHFNAWHRYFLHLYQENLRGPCGYGRTRPLPWWDESRDAGKFVNSPVFGPDYYGDAPLVALDAAGKEKATCVSTGPFKDLTLNIGPQLNFTAHCLSRAINETRTAWTAKSFVDAGNAFNEYWDMAFAQDEYPHRGGHEGIGSVMGDVYASPGDPLFYMHHTFIDRNWWFWQKAKPADRTFLIGGYNSTTAPREIVHMQTPLRFMGFVPDVPLKIAMDTESGAPFCYTYDY